MIDFDEPNAQKDNLDEECVKLLNTQGYVHYKKNGRFYYMTKEWAQACINEKNIPD